MDNASFGRLMRWGRNTEGSKPWLEKVLKDPAYRESLIKDLQEKGITKAALEQARNFYENAAKSGDQQFKDRANGLERIIESYPNSAAGTMDCGVLGCA
jgi:hypothetical protein